MSDDLENTGTLFDLQAQTWFVYVKIPISRQRLVDPFHQREHELANRLQAAAAGNVIGWGESMSEAAEDGEQHPIHQRIDITTQDLAHTRQHLWQLLVDLNVPVGTEIHYTLAGQPCVDIYLHEAAQSAASPAAAHSHKQWQLGVSDR